MRGSAAFPGMMMAVMLAALAAIAGCGSGGDNGGPASPLDGVTDIRGYITSISAAEGGRGGDMLGSVLIEGELTDDISYDRANATVTEDTRIFMESGGGRVKATFFDLQVGQYVEAVFTGPVAESYPVQATASEIIVLR